MDRAKLFVNGGSQAVRLPQKYRFEGEEVYIKSVGDAVVLLPKGEGASLLREALTSFSPDFMESREEGELQIREEL